MGAEASRAVDWEARATRIASLNAPDGVDAFFNRTGELQDLLTWLSEPPQSVQVLIGPYDCGKTRLLRRLQELWESNDYLAATSPLFFFDLRKLGWGTPQDAANHLVRAFNGWAQRFRVWASKASSCISLRIPGVEAQMDNIMGVHSQSYLAVVMMRFADFVDANPEAFPFIILDEADRLKDWDPQDIRTLMGCFKSLIKQDNRAYLLLSSSDDFFRHWLKEMFHPGQWNPVGVGFFAEDEAYRFFTGYCVPGVRRTLPQDFERSDWPGVYDICGGSPVLLKQCAATAARWHLTWRVSAETLRNDCISRIETGLGAQLSNNDGFDGQKYRQICMAIVKDEFIGVRKAKIEVFNKDSEECNAQLLAMRRGNFVHVRYVTARTLYADIKRGSTGKEFELIMARSPADRAAMRELLEEED